MAITTQKKNKKNTKVGANNNDIVISLCSYDYKLLDHATSAIVDSVCRTGAEVRGPVPLPTKRERYDTLRSPHVNSISREAWEMKIYSRVITIRQPTGNTMQALQGLNMSVGVNIEIEATTK